MGLLCRERVRVHRSNGCLRGGNTAAPCNGNLKQQYLLWLALILLGIGLLVLSALGKLGVMQDLAAILASIFLGVASVGSWAVDTVTGFGVLTSDTRYVLMENHTIYHYDLYGYVLGIVFLISLLNLYRLFLDYRRVTKQEAMEGDMEKKKE